jgi:hypothetical protein
MRNLLRDSWLVASASEGDNIGEVQSHILQGENSRSRVNWLYLTMVLLKAIVYEHGLSLGKKHITMIGRRHAYRLFPSWWVVIEEAGLLMLSW